MFVYKEISALKGYIRQIKRKAGHIGFVPTMGALHEGHISLLKQSVIDNEITICSIYVNPTQFTNSADLEKYPKSLAQDILMLENAGCDVLFAPSDQEMYPKAPKINFEFGLLGEVMEGYYRKGHFNGVAIIVSKLFNIIQPDTAYFGQKDLQQALIIKQLINDLSFDIKLNVLPVIREADGLAMSSRNVRLSANERAIAPLIYKTLQKASELLKSNFSIEKVKQMVSEKFESEPRFKLEYFEIVDAESLQHAHEIKNHNQIALCISAYLGPVRLIDNMFLFS